MNNTMQKPSQCSAVLAIHDVMLEAVKLNDGGDEESGLVGSAKGVFGLKKPKISKKCKVAFFP
jgi:hypothetical protein